MNPYQKAAEKIRASGEQPVNFLKNAALSATAGGIATGASKVVSKMIPAIGALINNYVPDNISAEGLKKLDPRFGTFIDGALDQGYSYGDVRNALGEKIDKSQQQMVKEERNIIEQHSPELHQFISEEIKKGRNPQQAGALAIFPNKGGKHFGTIVDKLTKQYKIPWSSIIESVYGSGEMAQPQQQQQSSNQQQVGSGQQALMSILDRINQRLGNQ